MESGAACDPTTSVPPRCYLPGASVAATHTAPPITARSRGAFWTCTTFTTVPDRGSICESVPPNRLLTQTPSRATAMPSGPSPTATVAVMAFDLVSIRETVLSSAFATHTGPIACGEV